MNQLPIKASQISNLTDARYFAAQGVEWLTFDLDPGSEARLSHAEIHAIREWIEGPKIVGNFGLQDAREILDQSEALQLDAIQLHPYLPLHQLDLLEGKNLIQKFVLDNLETTTRQSLIQCCQERSSWVKYFTVDGTTNQLNWQQIQHQTEWVETLGELCQEYNIFFQLSFPANNPHSFLDAIQPYGLDFAGSEEEKVGFKSFDDLDELFEHLEILI